MLSGIWKKQVVSTRRRLEELDHEYDRGSPPRGPCTTRGTDSLAAGLWSSSFSPQCWRWRWSPGRRSSACTTITFSLSRCRHGSSTNSDSSLLMLLVVTQSYIHPCRTPRDFNAAMKSVIAQVSNYYGTLETYKERVFIPIYCRTLNSILLADASGTQWNNYFLLCFS